MRWGTFFSLAALCGQTLFAADWPQWRGPTRDGHAPKDGIIIKTLPEQPRVVWKTKAGPGLSSPIVSGNWVIQFDAADGKETLRGMTRDSGAEKWRVAIDQTFHDTQGPDGPRGTPIADGERVYAVSCRGTLACLRLKDGSKVWSTNFHDFGAVFIGEKGTAPGATRHGNNGTPLIVGDRLYVCVGGTDNAGVVCFDKMTGAVLWKSQKDQAAYAPPMLAHVSGADQLVCFTAEGLIGLDPSNGKLLWRAPIKTAYARHATTPVWFDNVIVVSSHQAGMIGTRIDSKPGGGFEAKQAWISRDQAMNFSSPVSLGNYLYGLGPRKNVICVEISSGKEKWSQEGCIQTSADRAYAGFLLLGSNVLMLNDTGALILFAASPEQFKELGRAQVCGANWCNPAYADGRLYLRDGNKGDGELMCLDLVTENK
jgi:outer membrane protein assembly factor BamB